MTAIIFTLSDQIKIVCYTGTNHLVMQDCPVIKNMSQNLYAVTCLIWSWLHMIM